MHAKIGREFVHRLICVAHPEDFIVDRVSAVIGSREVAKQLRVVLQLRITDRLLARRAFSITHQRRLRTKPLLAGLDQAQLQGN